MVTVHRKDGFKIEVRGGEHNPPHFHVTSADADLMIDLRTFKILRGEGPRKVAEAAIAWVKDHQDELLKKWSELNEQE